MSLWKFGERNARGPRFHPYPLNWFKITTFVANNPHLFYGWKQINNLGCFALVIFYKSIIKSEIESIKEEHLSATANLSDASAGSTVGKNYILQQTSSQELNPIPPNLLQTLHHADSNSSWNDSDGDQPILQKSILKWKSDESLGMLSTISPVLYSNINLPHLRNKFPDWPDRVKQIAKIWRGLPNEKRQPYLESQKKDVKAQEIDPGKQWKQFHDIRMQHQNAQQRLIQEQRARGLGNDFNILEYADPELDKSMVGEGEKSNILDEHLDIDDKDEELEDDVIKDDGTQDKDLITQEIVDEKKSLHIEGQKSHGEINQAKSTQLHDILSFDKKDLETSVPFEDTFKPKDMVNPSAVNPIASIIKEEPKQAFSSCSLSSQTYSPGINIKLEKDIGDNCSIQKPHNIAFNPETQSLSSPRPGIPEQLIPPPSYRMVTALKQTLGGHVPQNALPPQNKGVFPLHLNMNLRQDLPLNQPNVLSSPVPSNKPLLLQEQPLLLEDLVEQEKREQRRQNQESLISPHGDALLSDIDFERLKDDVFSGPPDDSLGGPGSLLGGHDPSLQAAVSSVGVPPSSGSHNFGPPPYSLLWQNRDSALQLGPRPLTIMQNVKAKTAVPAVLGSLSSIPGGGAPAKAPTVQAPTRPFNPNFVPTPENVPVDALVDPEKLKATDYEEYLLYQHSLYSSKQHHFETEVGKLRKIKKALNAKQRQLRKNGSELAENDALELARISQEQSGIQKQLEQVRKQCRQSTVAIQDYRLKQQKRQQQPQQSQAAHGVPRSPLHTNVSSLQSSPQNSQSPLQFGENIQTERFVKRDSFESSLTSQPFAVSGSSNSPHADANLKGQTQNLLQKDKKAEMEQVTDPAEKGNKTDQSTAEKNVQQSLLKADILANIKREIIEDVPVSTSYIGSADIKIEPGTTVTRADGSVNQAKREEMNEDIRRAQLDKEPTPPPGEKAKPIKRKRPKKKKLEQQTKPEGVVVKKKCRRSSSKIEEGYENYVETWMNKLTNLPPLRILEPTIQPNFSAIPVYGAGDLNVKVQPKPWNELSFGEMDEEKDTVFKKWRSIKYKYWFPDSENNIKKRKDEAPEKTVLCPQHAHRGNMENKLDSVAVFRRVYINREEHKQVASMIQDEKFVLRIGSLIFLNIGQLLPTQIQAFHNTNCIYPLPGVDTLNDYNFRYGRSPFLELPLAINPTGCARSEPKLRTHFKRPHTLHTCNTSRVVSYHSPFAGMEVSSPYIKQFVHSKSSQYRKMKIEWRNNVFLARSRIQLSYDYKFEVEDDQHKIPCLCGAPNCRKWMN
ncbi:hypothetical protein TNCV_1461801 [Trichonephila clavipes]|nr:hypothetical protein TNCV_1461801 [Trichonephila clavipes]